MLLEICSLLAAIDSNEQVLDSICRHLSTIISPASSSSSRLPSAPQPNSHALVLRCLDVLPVSMWSERLGELEMGIIMEGLNSTDDTIRRAVSHDNA